MTDINGPGDLLRATRRVMLSGELSSATVSETTLALMYLDGLSDEPVSLLVNAAGGELGDIAGLGDTLALMRAPVTIDIRGRAHGAVGALVAAAPGLRRIGPLASVSLRLAASQLARGLSADAAAAEAERHAELHRGLAGVIGRKSGQTIDWVLGQFERGSVMNADQAIEAGLVDSQH